MTEQTRTGQTETGQTENPYEPEGDRPDAEFGGTQRPDAEELSSDVPGPVSGDIADPDLAAARGHEERVAEEVAADGLVTDELRPETEQTEFEPPHVPSHEVADPPTAEDDAAGETIEDRLAQEEPDQQA